MNPIVDLYEESQSIKAVSRVTKMSEGKIRKILVTEGAYQSEMSDEVARLLKLGLTPKEIEKELQRSGSCISSYIPYSKGEYGRLDASENAKKIREWREKEK